MPKISVIIPIYNVEKYLRQCLDSVVNQILKDIEIICVNDGSPDNCGTIIAEYAQKDSRIVVINKANGGYGSAVNAGLRAALGEYVGIVESDDWIESNMYAVMYALADEQKADIVKCDFYKYDSFARVPSVPYPHGRANLQDIYPEKRVFKVADAPLILAYHSSVWAGIYKSELIKSCCFQEVKGAGYVDFPFTFEILLKAERIALCYDRLLHYRMEDEQNSSTKNPGKQSLQMLERVEYVKSFLQIRSLLQIYGEEFYYHASLCVNGFFYKAPREFQDEYYERTCQFYTDLPETFAYKYFSPELQRFVLLIKSGRKDLLIHKRTGLLLYMQRIYYKLVPEFLRLKINRIRFSLDMKVILK